jgi:hypothetical protein
MSVAMPKRITTYKQAKAANEIIKVQKSTVQLKALQASVVDCNQTQTQVYQLARDGREEWRQFAETVATELSATLSVEWSTLTDCLHQAVEINLQELGELSIRVN